MNRLPLFHAEGDPVTDTVPREERALCWSVRNTETGRVEYFLSEEDARAYCLLYGHCMPLSMRAPLFQEGAS